MYRHAALKSLLPGLASNLLYHVNHPLKAMLDRQNTITCNLIYRYTVFSMQVAWGTSHDTKDLEHNIYMMQYFVSQNFIT